MTEQEKTPTSERPGGASGDESGDRALLRLETRLARAEAQILGLQESMADVHTYFRMAKQRSLYLRIGLLFAALAAFLYLRYKTA
jgi:hypothetical protein